jgi:hypothetical protein
MFKNGIKKNILILNVDLPKVGFKVNALPYFVVTTYGRDGVKYIQIYNKTLNISFI